MSDGIAYLVSQYPALSHTFIEREVQALRALGVPVSTYSVRSADRREPFPPATNSEVARTPVLQGNALGVYLGDLFHAARRSPVALLRTLIAALRLGPPGARARLWQVFYLVEAIRLLRLLERDGTARRIHVHHANNAADIARLTVMLARRVHPGDSRWRWTLGLHGPTEFLDAPGHDLRAKLEDAAAIACISEYAVRTARSIAPSVPADRFGIVRMSAPQDRFPAWGEERAQRTADPCTILFVGRLVPEKAPDLLLDAVVALRADGLDVHAVIAGAGPLHAALQSRIDDEALAEVVDLMGPIGQHELPELYRLADVFCLPSHAEGIPVVLMEAMLTELPVVSTTVAGIPELVTAENGLLVAPGDTEALVVSLRSLLEDRHRRRALGAAGRHAVLERHRAEPNARALQNLLFGEAAESLSAN